MQGNEEMSSTGIEPVPILNPSARINQTTAFGHSNPNTRAFQNSQQTTCVSQLNPQQKSQVIWKRRTSCMHDEDHEDLHLEFSRFHQHVQNSVKLTPFNSPCHIHYGSNNNSCKNTITCLDRRNQRLTSKLQLNITLCIQHQITPNLYQNYHHSMIYTTSIMICKNKELEF